MRARSRCSAVSRLALATALLVPGRSARAAPVCAVSEVLGDRAADASWRRAIDSLDRQLASSPEICHGVELTVRWEGTWMRIFARSRDGAEASRPVPSALMLSAVAFGLLASAPVEPPPPAEDPLDVPPPTQLEPARPTAARPVDLLPHLDVSAAFGARAAFPTRVVMGDLEVRADLVLQAWLLGVSVRAAPFSRSAYLAPDPDAYQEAALGLALGRELIRGRTALDVLGGGNMTYIWMAQDARRLAAEHAQLRVAALCRLTYAVSPWLHLQTTLDGELAPVQLIQNVAPLGLAPFPVYTVGLRVGAEVSL